MTAAQEKPSIDTRMKDFEPVFMVAPESTQRHLKGTPGDHDQQSHAAEPPKPKRDKNGIRILD